MFWVVKRHLLSLPPPLCSLAPGSSLDVLGGEETLALSATAAVFTGSWQFT